VSGGTVSDHEESTVLITRCAEASGRPGAFGCLRDDQGVKA
jgi:hypothetical protein